VIFLCVKLLSYEIFQKTKENHNPQLKEEEFPVIKRNADETTTEIMKPPAKAQKKEDILTRKKVPITTTAKPLKERDTSLNAKVNNFSNSLRSGTVSFMNLSPTVKM